VTKGAEALEDAIQPWLDALASGSAAPGGGAAAALAAATAAALVAMTCRSTIGRPAYVDAEPLMTRVLEQAEQLRVAAFAAMREDGDAYRKVIAAHKLPRGSEAERGARASAVTEALIGAAEVPLRVARMAASVIDLARSIEQAANRNALGDLNAAASMARAALEISAQNVEINLSGIAGARADAMRSKLCALK